MDKTELDKRLAELGAERERLGVELEKARTEARDALIAGKSQQEPLRLWLNGLP